jgi:hypothetical protein
LRSALRNAPAVPPFERELAGRAAARRGSLPAVLLADLPPAAQSRRRHSLPGDTALLAPLSCHRLLPAVGASTNPRLPRGQWLLASGGVDGMLMRAELS